jgi:hypothetical protein
VSGLLDEGGGVLTPPSAPSWPAPAAASESWRDRSSAATRTRDRLSQSPAYFPRHLTAPRVLSQDRLPRLGHSPTYLAQRFAYEPSACILPIKELTTSSNEEYNIPERSESNPSFREHHWEFLPCGNER